MNRPTITIVTPVFNEEESLPHYEAEVKRTLMENDQFDFRVVFVDDGSHDRSWQIVREIAARDARFTGLRLSRNFGAHVALSAGIAAVDSDAAATLACDLQDPPETVLRFAEAWRSGAQIVWGARKTRIDSLWRVWASNAFYQLVKRYAMPRRSQFATGSFFLIDRRVTECFKQFKEHHRITFALVAWTGFEQAVVEYDRRARVAGSSGWTFWQMMKAVYDTFISFSSVPIKLMTIAGVGLFLANIPVAIYTVYCWVVGDPLRGWTSLMLGMLAFFGIQFLMMGLLGEYLYRIYTEVVRRPLYFVSDTAGAAVPR